jgi:hypothetical protein
LDPPPQENLAMFLFGLEKQLNGPGRLFYNERTALYIESFYNEFDPEDRDEKTSSLDRRGVRRNVFNVEAKVTITDQRVDGEGGTLRPSAEGTPSPSLVQTEVPTSETSKPTADGTSLSPTPQDENSPSPTAGDKTAAPTADDATPSPTSSGTTRTLSPSIIDTSSEPSSSPSASNSNQPSTTSGTTLSPTNIDSSSEPSSFPSGSDFDLSSEPSSLPSTSGSNQPTTGDATAAPTTVDASSTPTFPGITLIPTNTPSIASGRAVKKKHGSTRKVDIHMVLHDTEHRRLMHNNSKSDTMQHRLLQFTAKDCSGAFLAVQLTIELSYQLRGGDIDLDDIIAEPFRREEYRAIYMNDFLMNEDFGSVGPFADVTCTSPILETAIPTYSPTLTTTDSPTTNPPTLVSTSVTDVPTASPSLVRKIFF